MGSYKRFPVEVWNLFEELLKTRLTGIKGKLAELELNVKKVAASETADKLTTAYTIDGVEFDGSADIKHYAVCTTASATAIKTVTCTGFKLKTGAMIAIRFDNADTSTDATQLNVNSTGARLVKYRDEDLPSEAILAGSTLLFQYNGNWYEFVGTVGKLYTPFTAATSELAGSEGLVPAPGAGKDASYFLNSQGNWTIPHDTTYNVFTTATSTNAGTQGLVPAPTVGTNNTYFLNAAGSWSIPYAVFSTAANGLVPKPSSTSTSIFLCSNGSWAVPTNTTYKVFSSGNATVNGTLIPSIASGTSGKYLHSDGTWSTLPTATSSNLGLVKTGSGITNTDGTISVSEASTVAAGLLSSSDKTKLNALSVDATNGELSVLTSAGKLHFNNVEYIVGTQTASTGSWTGVTKDSELYAGKIIIYKLPYAGSGNATLNLTLATGGTTGAKAVYRYASTRLTTQYGANYYIPLIYNGSYWFAFADYDTNYYDRIRLTNAIAVASGAIQAVCFVGSTNGTAYKQLSGESTFDIRYKVFYNSSAVADAANMSTGLYWALGSINLQTMVGDTSRTFTTQSPLFLKGTLNGTVFTVHSDVITTTIPTTDDGYTYLYVGRTYSTYQANIDLMDQTFYAYKAGVFQPINLLSIKAIQDSSGQQITSTYVKGIAAGTNGSITITKGDDTASTVTAYTLPAATSSALGGVKIGSTAGLVNTNGTITLAAASANTLGGVRISGNSSGIVNSSGVISLAEATKSSIGGVKIGSGINVSSGVISVSEVSTTTSGLMTASDKVKLNGIESEATKNTAGTNVNISNGAINVATGSTSSLGVLKVGSNISVSDGTISLSKANVTNALGYTPPTTNTTYSVFTSTNCTINGTLIPSIASGTSGKYLQSNGSWAVPTNTTYAAGTGISLNSTTFGLKSATTSEVGGIKLGSSGFLKYDGTWATPSNTTYAVATSSANGLMSKDDKAKLDAISAPLQYKGTVANFSDLPTTGLATGHVYNITNAGGTDANGTAIKAGDNVAYNGTGWDALSGTVDLSGYVVKDGSKVLSTNDFTDAYKTKLDGIATSANNYTLPNATTSTKGGVIVGTGLSVSSGTIALAAATTGTIGGIKLGSSGFLRYDGTWATPTNNTYAVMTAASSSASGASGLTPTVAAGNQARFLRGDATWAVPTNTTYSAGTGLSLSGTTFSLADATDGTIGGVKVAAIATSNISLNSGSIAVPAASSTQAGVVKYSGSTGNYLRGDGSWATPTNTTYSVATTSDNGLMPAVDKSIMNSHFHHASTAYAVGAQIVVAGYPYFVLECTTAGTTSATVPTSSFTATS